MAGDLLLGTRGLLNLVINGNAQITGLKDRVAAAFPTSTPKVQLRDHYDPDKQEQSVIPSKLDREYVTLQMTLKSKLPQRYRMDRLPQVAGLSNNPGFAWVDRLSLQLDVWGRTPVKVQALCDVLEVEFVRMHAQMWEVGRIALQMDGFETVPYEEETGIFRALARGYCQAAAFAAD